jgi:HAD superfamily hydrolase (TIGR01509 family)
LTEIKAFVFDFIGTLTAVKGYSLEASELKLHKALVKSGFNVRQKDFLEEYTRSTEKFRLVRYQELVEVTNSVWISHALHCLGFSTNPEDAKLKTAVNVFFANYLTSLELKPCAKQLLTGLQKHYKLGLISNFTYAPVIYAALRKLGLNKFFNTVLVSEDVGWRKPSTKIFQQALQKLGVNGEETVYVGDTPKEDIGGASSFGMKTVFLPSQFNTLESLNESQIKPDLIVRDLCEMSKILPEFIRNLQK